MDERRPIWIVPARVKAGTYLPTTASADEIEAAAVKAAADATRCAAEGGMQIVYPTARVDVTDYEAEDGSTELMVRAFAVCAEVAK